MNHLELFDRSFTRLEILPAEYREPMELWADELKRTNLKQGTESLFSEKGYCCLGVLGKVGIKHDNIENLIYHRTRISGVFKVCEAIPEYSAFLDIMGDYTVYYRNDTDDNQLLTLEALFIRLNDNLRLTFSQIADIITERLLK